jgi:dihydropteroate synthase
MKEFISKKSSAFSLSGVPIGKILKIHNKLLDLSKPQIMGILNTTPDSFSDGGRYLCVDMALKQAAKMVADGAGIIDIGAESTRPGAPMVLVQEELDRLLPIIEKIKQNLDVIISIDTSKPQVMEEVIKLKVDMINDVRALRERDNHRDGLNILASARIPVILMHMKGRPNNMQHAPRYEHVIDDIYNFFEHRIDICLKFGIERKNIFIDPGFGFGKTWYDNASLLKYLSKFNKLNCPIVVGLSRKSMIEQNNKGSIPAAERLPGSIALAIMAVERGASIIRCHDVKETKQAVDLAYAVLEDGNCVEE